MIVFAHYHPTVDQICCHDSKQTFFKIIILLTINFRHTIGLVQITGGNFQVQDYVFFTSKMKSTTISAVKTFVSGPHILAIFINFYKLLGS